MDFCTWRSSQSCSLISVMEYLSGKCKAKKKKKNVAYGNWLHKTFCYFLVFVYRADKWSGILKPVRGNPYSAPCGSGHLEGKLRDSVLAGPLYDSFICHIFLLSIPLSARGMFMNISTKWYESNNTSPDLGYFTENRSDVSPEIAFLSPGESFHSVCISPRCSCAYRETDSWVLHMAADDLSLVRCAA